MSSVLVGQLRLGFQLACCLALLGCSKELAQSMGPPASPGDEAGVPAVDASGEDPTDAATASPPGPPPVLTPEGGVEPPVEELPSLVRTIPEDGEDNVWVGAPLQLVFSAPVAPESTAEAKLVLSVDGDSVPVAGTRLSADGTTLLADLALPLSFDLPAQVNAELQGSVIDVAGKSAPVEASWTFTLPVWQSPIAQELVAATRAGSATPLDLAADEQGRPYLAWIDENSVKVARSEQQSAATDVWVPLAEPLPATASSAVTLALDTEQTPIVAFSDTGAGALQVHKYIEQSWQSMAVAGLPTEAASRPLLRRSESGVELGYQRGTDAIAFADVSAAASGAVPEPWSAESGAIVGYDWVPTEAGTAIAVLLEQEEGPELRVARWATATKAWEPLGASLNQGTSAPAGALSLAASDGELFASWAEQEQASAKLYVARYDADSDSWVLLGRALNVLLEASVTEAQVAVGPGGEPVVVWTEVSGKNQQVYAARWRADGWRSLGGRLSARGSQLAGGLSATLNVRGEPQVAWFAAEGEFGAVQLQRYNESPNAPAGLLQRLESECRIPKDSDPDFPATLAATGCYESVPEQKLAPGLIPYSVNTELWSDGAKKRRFLYVPPGETIKYNATDWWQVPTGTILVKEFWVEVATGDPESRRPMETRIMIKRCESGNCRASWQGYSYRWNEEGTEAELLDNEDVIEQAWPTADGSYRHLYPARKQCTDCHVQALGGTLGLQARQMNRWLDFDGGLDNQLRTLARIGLFGDSLKAEDIDAAPRLPQAHDPREDNTLRVRAYLDINCSHCHRPDGRRPEINFRFNARLVGAEESGRNICNLLTPGSAQTSPIFQKAQMRPPNLPAGVKGDPMPPLATLIADTEALSWMERWINEMEDCP